MSATRSKPDQYWIAGKLASPGNKKSVRRRMSVCQTCLSPRPPVCSCAPRGFVPRVQDGRRTRVDASCRCDISLSSPCTRATSGADAMTGHWREEDDESWRRLPVRVRSAPSPLRLVGVHVHELDSASASPVRCSRCLPACAAATAAATHQTTEQSTHCDRGARTRD